MDVKIPYSFKNVSVKNGKVFVVCSIMIAAKMDPDFWSQKMIWLLPVTRVLLFLPNGDQEVFFVGDFEVLTSTLSVDWMADQSQNTPNLATMEKKSITLFNFIQRIVYFEIH